jgi:hypothetical protein
VVDGHSDGVNPLIINYSDVLTVILGVCVLVPFLAAPLALETFFSFPVLEAILS